MDVGKIQSNQFNDQVSFFENYQKNNLIKIRNDLKNQFENIDQEIFLSSWRKNKGYIPDGFKSRTILTIYGPVTYKRRVYKYWNKTKYDYVFLADKKMQIEKYSRIAGHLKFKILEQIATGKRQRDICDMFLNANLTRATVSNIIKLANFQPSLKHIKVVGVKISECLYVNMDETFIKLRKDKKMRKYRIRLVTFHTGYNKIYSTDKRKVLNNKRVYYQVLPISKKINTTKFMMKLEKIARKFYSNIDDIKIIIGGDGANWIREASNYWPNSDYILDKFHAFRYLKQIFPNWKNRVNYQSYQNSKNLFQIGAYDDLIALLSKVKVRPEKEAKLEKIINYFHNNAFGVSNQKLWCNIGVSAEGDISHIIKWLLGYGSKAYNYHTFKNMLFLKVAEINRIDVLSFIKRQYQKEKEAIRNFYWKNYWATKENDEYFYYKVS